MYLKVIALVDLGGSEERAPPATKLFESHAVFGDIYQSRKPKVLGPPPRGNPGSATAVV